MTDALVNLGEHLQFFGMLVRASVMERFEKREFLTQLSQISWRSLPTTMTAGLFTGAILAVQFYMQIRDFGAESALGGLNTSGTLREVGPILIAFMLAGKVGAFTSAEIGTMKVTDQIEAIRCLGVNPVSFLLVPRFLAVVISSTLLLIFGLVISVTGGILASWASGAVNPQQYLLMIPKFATPSSILLALIKSVVFGIIMGHICCANGYWATGGTQGVGQAVRKTAVQSMVLIVVSDFLISWTLSAFFPLMGIA
ncbi:MAG: ABC transporter permease [Bdellovibrionales bacterium]|nr:ABC transporter permease [Bdellovibrionales bacterium]